MAHHNRKVDEEMVQGILLDNPGFLKEIVERVWNSPGSTDTFSLRRASFSHSTLLEI